MSFFKLSDGKDIDVEGGKFEMGGGDMTPIPKNTDVLASIDEAKWAQDKTTGENYISLRWAILAPAVYANRKIFQKLKVENDDSKKADKAKRMLFAIDANAGGKLAKAGEEPSNDSMSLHLSNKPMVLKLGVWESEDKSASGNWVMAVSPRKAGGGGVPAAAKAAAPAKAAPSAGSLSADYDAAIGF